MDIDWTTLGFAFIGLIAAATLVQFKANEAKNKSEKNSVEIEKINRSLAAGNERFNAIKEEVSEVKARTSKNEDGISGIKEILGEISSDVKHLLGAKGEK